MEINELSLEEKVAQLFMVGVHEKDIDGIIDLIQNYKIGGVVLYRRNYDNYKELIEVVNKIKRANSKNNIPIFISTDQEGGRVNRMPEDVKNLQCATKFSETNDIEKIRESGRIIGEMLNKSGISMNYGPVLDIKRFRENHAIGDRCYGESKEVVEKYGIEVMKEMQKQNVIAAIKHFPGHGLTQKDSHFQVPRIYEKIDKLEERKNDIIRREENKIQQQESRKVDTIKDTEEADIIDDGDLVRVKKVNLLKRYYNKIVNEINTNNPLEIKR